MSRDRGPTFDSLAQKFAGQSDNGRINTLCLTKSVGGFLAFTRHKKLVGHFLIRRAYRTEEADPASLTLAGTRSNLATACKFALASPSVVANVPIVVPKDKVPKEFKKGKLIKNCPSLKPFAPEDGKFNIIAVPVCLPCPYGGYVVTGELQQAALTFLEDVAAFAPFWGELIVDYFSDAAAAVIVASSKQTNEATEFLPKLTAGQTWADNPFVKLESPDDDLEEILAETITALDEDLQEIRDAFASPPLPPFVSGGGLDDFPEDVQTPKQSATVIDVPTETELKKARRLVLGVNIADDGTLVQPTLTQIATQILHVSGAKHQNATMQCCLSNVEELMADSEHYVERSVEMPILQGLGIGNIAQVNNRPTISRNLDDEATQRKAKMGFFLAYFLPDSATTAEKKSERDSERTAEEILGESTDRLSKMDTSIVLNTEIGGSHNYLKFLANVVCNEQTWYVCKGAEVPTPPLIYWCCLQQADRATCKDIKRWWRNNHRTNPHLTYWLYNQLELVFVALVKVTENVTLMSMIARGDWSQFPTQKVKLAIATFKAAMEKFSSVSTGSDVIPQPEIYLTSSAKKRADAAETAAAERKVNAMVAKATAASDASNRKRNNPGSQRDGGGNQPPSAKRIPAGNTILGSEKGDFIFDPVEAGGREMKFPFRGSKAKTLCRPFAKQDDTCPWGLTCEWKHEYVNDMSPEDVRHYKQYVLNTKGVSFNPATVRSDILQCEFIKNEPKKSSDKQSAAKGEEAKE